MLQYDWFTMERKAISANTMRYAVVMDAVNGA